MPAQYPEPLELRPRIAEEMRAQKIVLLIGVVALLSVVLIVLFLVFQNLAAQGSDWQSIAGLYAGKFAKNPFGHALNWIVLIALLGHTWHLWKIQMRERLTLTRNGIEFHSPLPLWVPWLPKSWSLSWSQVRSVSLRGGLAGAPAVQMTTLEIEGNGRKYRLLPYHWIDPANYQRRPFWLSQGLRRTRNKEALKALLDDNLLLRYVAAAIPHLEIEKPSALLQEAFAIEKNPAALRVTIAFFVLLAYALLDGVFLLGETYAGSPPVEAFVAVATVAMIAGAAWLLRSRVPVGESVVIAFLAAGAAGAAAYPGLLRLNALTDMDGLKPYEYRLAAGGVLQPSSAGPPELSFPHYYDFWAQFETGSIHTFELRHGGLGFYQLNIAPVEEDMRVFYRKQAR